MDRESVDLPIECDVFCRYLTGRHADEYIRKTYRQSHGTLRITPPGAMCPFDTFLTRFARRNWRCARLADIYTRWFYPRSVLRKKLMLVLAILECSRSTYDHFEAGDMGSRLRFWLSVARRSIIFSVYGVVAVFLFSTAQLVFTLMPTERK